MTHISDHFVAPRRVPSLCRWDNCGTKTLTKTKLLEHLTAIHGMPLRHDSMKQAKFCHECSEYFVHGDVWEDHCASHVSDPDLFCGQIVCRGIIIFARKCMFCLADTNLTASERYYGFTHAPNFFRHLQMHLKSLFKWPVSCPHPKCRTEINSEPAFWNHSRAVHGIAKYKLESIYCAEDAAATLSEVDCLSEAEMIETDISSEATTDEGEDEDEDDSDGVNEDLRGSHFIFGKGTAHSYAAGLSTSTKRGHSLDDASQNCRSPLGSIHMGLSHAETGRKIDQEVESSQTTGTSNTNRSVIGVTHGERKETADRDSYADIYTCTGNSDWPLHDDWEARGMQHEQMANPFVRGGTDSRSLRGAEALQDAGNGSHMALFVAEPFSSDLTTSRTTVDSNGNRRDPVTMNEENDYLIVPETNSRLRITSSQISDDIFGAVPSNVDNPERYPHLRPISSHLGRPCDAPGCTEVFRFVRDLNYHLIKVHNRSQHTCHVGGCGKMFRDATRLRDHVRTHSGRKTLVCSFEQCGRTFARADTLLRHKQSVHEKERLYVCDLIKGLRKCKSAFDASWKLKRHKEGVHKCI